MLEKIKMKSEPCFTAQPNRSAEPEADPSGENSKKNSGIMPSEGITSFGAVLLAFLATQHHNLHMLLIAIGIGGAGAGFMTIFPLVRQIMLLLSLAMAGLMVFRAFDSRRPISMRILNIVSVLVTIGFAGWSVFQFGF